MMNAIGSLLSDLCARHVYRFRLVRARRNKSIEIYQVMKYTVHIHCNF